LQVVDVRIIMDRNTRRSKGFAYIEMATRESIIPALSLAGQTLMGQSVMVKSSEVRRRKPSTPISGCASLSAQPPARGTE
jgi:RNA-binding protein 39